MDYRESASSKAFNRGFIRIISFKFIVDLRWFLQTAFETILSGQCVKVAMSIICTPG